MTAFPEWWTVLAIAVRPALFPALSLAAIAVWDRSEANERDGGRIDSNPAGDFNR